MDNQEGTNTETNTASRIQPDGSVTDPTPLAPVPQQPAHHRKARFLSVLFIVLACGSVGFLGGWLGSKHDDATPSVQQQQVILKTQGQVISQLAKDVGPSVVSVETTTRGVSDTSVFGVPRTIEQQSAGTGIVINENGLIMTNRHVVPVGTTAVDIVMSDGIRFEDVEVVGRTNSRDSLDIAFLKIKDTKGKKLTAAKIGDSSKMQVGDPVVAIGNALGQFENTVTSGIISGFGRSIQATDEDGNGSENLENLFQTDAAINQGNSGGPLMNLDGEVIGVNTAVASGENIGFSIPINDVKGLVDSVISKGKLERPYLGVVYISITADVAKDYDLSSEKGAYIPPASDVDQNPVISGGPAAKAGLKAKDIILKVGNDTIDQSHSLTSLLGKRNVGEKVKLAILRDGKPQTIEATLGTAPSE